MSGYTSGPLEGVEFVTGGWGVYAEDGTLLAAAFGEHAEARTNLIVAAFDLTDSLNKRETEAVTREVEAEPIPANFRCDIAARPARHEGQNERCATQCAHCRTLEERHAAANANPA